MIISIDWPKIEYERLTVVFPAAASTSAKHAAEYQATYLQA